MLFLALSDRAVGIMLLLLALIMAGAARDLSAIPANTVLTTTVVALAIALAILGADFVLKCPVLTRLSRFKEKKDLR